MACSACMTHTNPQPCCAPPARHFGNPESGPWRPLGHDYVQVTSPPWGATVLGVLAAWGGYQLHKNDPDKVGWGVPFMAGGLGIPTAMWFKYYFPPQ